MELLKNGITKISLFAMLMILFHKHSNLTAYLISNLSKLIQWILSKTEPFPTNSKRASCEGMLENYDEARKDTDQYVTPTTRELNKEYKATIKVKPSLTKGSSIQGEAGRMYHHVMPEHKAPHLWHSLLLNILLAFGCLVVGKFLKLTKPIYIISLPNSTEQYAHADQAFPPPQWTGKEMNVHISGIFAFQTTYFYYWEYSHTIGTTAGKRYKVYKKKCICLERGQFCMFLGNLIHAGYDFMETNGRMHVYLEIPMGITRESKKDITGTSPSFYNVKEPTLYNKFMGAKPNPK